MRNWLAGLFLTISVVCSTKSPGRSSRRCVSLVLALPIVSAWAAPNRFSWDQWCGCEAKAVRG